MAGRSGKGCVRKQAGNDAGLSKIAAACCVLSCETHHKYDAFTFE